MPASTNLTGQIVIVGPEASIGSVNATLVKFNDPPDMRHTGYLMITNVDRSSDQFVYRPSDRKVRRVRLDGMTVMGTDYTFDDITYRDMSDATYTRLPDVSKPVCDSALP